MLLGILGGALGVAGAASLSRYLATLIFGVSTVDRRGDVRRLYSRFDRRGDRGMLDSRFAGDSHGSGHCSATGLSQGEHHIERCSTNGS